MRSECPEWDRQLTDAYTSGPAEHLLQPRRLGVIFGSSAYRGSPLEHLVEHYLTDGLIRAVAREAASGRLLLVATTNVDTGETVVWDFTKKGEVHRKAFKATQLSSEWIARGVPMFLATAQPMPSGQDAVRIRALDGSKLAIDELIVPRPHA